MESGEKTSEVILIALERHIGLFIKTYLSSNILTTLPRDAHIDKSISLLPIASASINATQPRNPSRRTSIVALRMGYLAAIAHNQIQSESILTKRDVYYMCRSIFPNPESVDRALTILSKETGIMRNDLNIVAAPKGLVSGNLSFIDENGHYVDIAKFSGDGCLIPPRPERICEVKTQAKAIVIVEKEATFSSLLNDPRSEKYQELCITVTGKGYPDFATRTFVESVCNTQREAGLHLSVFLLTDADPHGLHIAFCYMRSLGHYNVKWIGVRPSDNGDYFRINPKSQIDLTYNENAMLNNVIQHMKSLQCTENHIKYASLLQELDVLKSTKQKFEMEALSTEGFHDNDRSLLVYLMTRMFDEGFRWTESASAYG